MRNEKIRPTPRTSNGNSEAQSIYIHDEREQVVITGCSFCPKDFGTVEQFKFHITDDVLPPLLDKLSVEVK
jgi:hypothetical protein